MGFSEELKGGKYSIYAQWTAIFSCFLLIVIGISSLGINPWALFFGIFSLGISAVILCLELPIVTRCCPTRGCIGSFIAFFESNLFRTLIYTGFSVLFFVGLSVYILLVIPAIFLLGTAVFYAIATFKRQELHRSFITGGKGVATAAQSASGV